MAVELGTGYVTIIPSAKGIGNGIESELRDPIKAAAGKAGDDASKGLTAGFRNGGGVKGVAAEVGNEVTGLGKKMGGLGGTFDSAAGNLRSKFGGVSDSILAAASSPVALAGAVGAAGAAAFSAVKMFEGTTVAVGKFRDATGLSSEEASRLYEALSDLGLQPDNVAGAIGRMEKAIGTNRDAFKEYGVTVATTKDGLVDANGTFLNAVDALNKIEDPAKRAEAGTKIFGRGWQNMAEVIATGAPALKSALESVQPSKVFSDADINSGRAVRDAFDSISDAGEGLLLTLGKSLAPAITQLAPIIGQLLSAVEPLAEAIGHSLASALKVTAPLLTAFASAAGPIIKAAALVVDALGGAIDNFTHLGSTVDANSSAMRRFEPIMKSVGLTQEGATRFAKELGLSQDQLSQAFRESGGNMTLAIEALYRMGVVLPARAAETDRLTGAANAYNKSIADQATRQNAINTEAARWTGLAAQYTAATERSAAAQERWSAALDGVAAQADNTQRQVDAFSKAIAQVATDASASMDASVGLADAYAGLSDSIKTNGAAWDINTQAGRDNYAAITDVADNIRTNLTRQLKDAGGNYEQVTKSADLYREQLRQQLLQAGYTSQQVQDYLRVLGLTPDQVSTAIELSGQAAAQATISLLNVSLDDFGNDGQTRNAYISAIARGDYQTALEIIRVVNGAPSSKTIDYVIRAQVKVGAYAGGTKSAPPGLAWVGEKGPELMAFGGGERVYDHAESMRLAAQAHRPMSSRAAAWSPRMTSTANSAPAGRSFNVGEVHLHDEVDVDGFFRAAEFRMMAAV